MADQNDTTNGHAKEPIVLLPFTDRTGVQIALGEKLLFPPSTSTPMVMDLVDATPILDPNAPPGALRLRFVMQMFVAVVPGGQIPAFRVGGERADGEQAPTPAPSNLIVMPGGKH